MSNETLVRQILVEIDRNPSISQRQLSANLGVSIGIVNWHMKRFVKKGLVKLQKTPVRRYLYYLTPVGFAEKAKLTSDYLKSSFDIFRQGRLQYEALFGMCSASHWENVILLGDSELVELACIALTQTGRGEGPGHSRPEVDPGTAHERSPSMPWWRARSRSSRTGGWTC